MGGVCVTQKRRRNEGDDMKWKIRGWVEEIGGERGMKGGGIMEKSV